MAAWQDIPWKKVQRHVFRLQKRIYQATLRGDVRTVHKLQNLLIKSWYARLLAVRRVTQDNRGRHTAGIDGVKSLTPPQRWRLAGQLQLNRTATPLRRTWIPKSGSATEKRPLGIPMAHAYCISLLRHLGIAVATPTSMNSVYQITQYSGLGLTNQVGACKKPSSKIAERFQLFRFFTSTRIRDRWRAIIS
jgi:hypothetical protein